MEAASHRFEEHTGEVQIHLRAPDRAGLYREAAVALAELMAPGATAGEGEEVPVEVHARDPEALLVDWIDELIYLVDTTGRVYPEVAIEHASETALRARLRGGVPDSLETPVKAATFHGLHVEEGEEGFSARLVLDV